MKRQLFFLISTLLTLFVWSACNDRSDLIVGKWERFDDRAAGSIIKVEKKGDVYQGSLIYTAEELASYGFKPKDIKWKNVKLKETNYYIAQDLQKGVDANGEVKKTTYVDIYIELVSDDILELSEFAKGQEAFGTHQKWKRIE